MTLVRFATDLETAALDGRESRRATWLVAQICELHADADDEARTELRRVLARHDTLRDLFCDEIARAAAELAKDPSPRRLRSGLAAAVLADRRPDEHVWATELEGLFAPPRIPTAVVDGLWQEACDLAATSETRRALQRLDTLRRTRLTASRSAAAGREPSGRGGGSDVRTAAASDDSSLT